ASRAAGPSTSRLTISWTKHLPPHEQLDQAPPASRSAGPSTSRLTISWTKHLPPHEQRQVQPPDEPP
ncbi:hypothetical protein LSAT2_020340, partial [Lamellibrachia satsuma]